MIIIYIQMFHLCSFSDELCEMTRGYKVSPQATRLVLAVGSTPEWEELWAEKATDQEFEAFLKAKCEEHSKPFLHTVEGLSITLWWTN